MSTQEVHRAAFMGFGDGVTATQSQPAGGPYTTGGAVDSGTVPQDAALPKRKTGNWWSWEVFGVVVSGVGIAGMSLLLHHFDGSPIPTWTFQLGSKSLAGKANRISFNAILELFSTLSRLAMAITLTKGLGQLTWVWFAQNKRSLADFATFNSAARQNVLGSVQLVWKLRGRHFAIVGALTMIALQAFGFFVHELVTYPAWPFGDFTEGSTPPISSSDSNHTVAMLANATNFPPGADLGNAPYYNVDSDMKSNIWASLFANDPNAAWSIPPYYCQTQNCTWWGYSSLGVCSRCSDLTSNLTKNCAPSSGCEVSLPNGFSLGGRENSRSNIMAMTTDFQPIVYTNYSLPIAIIQSITAYDPLYDPLNNAAGFPLFVNSSTPTNASECVLVPCVLKYDSAYAFTSLDRATQGLNGPGFSEAIESFWDNYTSENGTGSLNGPTIQVPPDPTRNDPTIYQMSQGAYKALQDYLQALLNGFVIANGNGTLSYQSVATVSQVQADAAGAMQAIYQPLLGGCSDLFGNNLPDWNMCSITSVALAMTKSIRDLSWVNESYPATGVTYTTEPMISVAWLWLVPIIAIWLLSVILLFGTIWKTHRAGVRAWGDNPLAMIFVRLTDDNLEEVRNYGLSEDDLRKKADHMWVQLQFTDREVELA